MPGSCVLTITNSCLKCTRASSQRSCQSTVNPAWKRTRGRLAAEPVLCGLRSSWQPNFTSAADITARSNFLPTADDAPACSLSCRSYRPLMTLQVRAFPADHTSARNYSYTTAEAITAEPVICWLHDHGIQTVLVCTGIMENPMSTTTNRCSSSKMFLSCLPDLTASDVDQPTYDANPTSSTPVYERPTARTILSTSRLTSTSSSYRAGSTDIPDPLSPLFPIVHRPRQVFRTTSRILT